MPLLNGATLMHEHTTIDLSSVKGASDTNLNCFLQTINEFKELYARGVRNVVDVTLSGMGRNVDYVRQVSEKSGVNIICATGFYTDKFLPPEVDQLEVFQLADIMIDEITSGIASTSVKAEIIGEIGTSKGGWTPREYKVFCAAVLAHKSTNVPITTHTTLGTFGHEQVEFFRGEGVDLSKVLISHADLSGSADYVLRMLDKGVYVGFDTVGKTAYLSDDVRISMLKEIEKAGFCDQVMLSMDITRKSHLKHMGGIGYTYLFDEFLVRAKNFGVSTQFIEKMLISNPQTYFSKEKK